MKGDLFISAFFAGRPLCLFDLTMVSFSPPRVS